MNVHIRGNTSLRVSEMNVQKSLGLVVAAGSRGARASLSHLQRGVRGCPCHCFYLALRIGTQCCHMCF